MQDAQQLCLQRQTHITDLVEQESSSGGVFKAASALTDRQRVEQAEYYFETGILPSAAQKAFAAPLITHGVSANRKVLETIAQYSLEQGLTSKLTQLEDLFPASMLSQ